jgi:nucleotide-binding universal stress UspA family protein
MFKHIVIGIEQLQDGADEVALAKKLLAPGGRLTFAHVYGSLAHGDTGTRYEAGERHRALELLEGVRKIAEVDAELHVIGALTTGRGLQTAAEEAVADLVVVGSSRRGLIGRILEGDDTRAALTRMPCAVAVAPAGYATDDAELRTIGVGYDGSVESIHAMLVGRQLAAETGAELSAFQAVSMPTTTYGPGPLPLSDTIEPLVAQARQQIAALGAVEAHAAYGKAAEELTIYSDSVDLLIVGSRGYGPIGRLIYGSTTLQLARTSRCPLLVLPHTANSMEAAPQAAHPNTTSVTAS